MKEITRRQSLIKIAAAATCSMFLLAGCSGNTDGGDAGSIEGTKINVNLAAGGWTNTVEKLLPEFESKTGVKVSLNVLGTEQLDNQYQVKLNSRSEDLDVMVYRPSQSTKLFADNGWLEDISDRVSGDEAWKWTDFSESSRAATTVDAHAFGVPLMTERDIIFYNKEMFAAKGIAIPKTMDELEAVAKALTDTTSGTYGVVMRGKANAAVTSFSSFLYSFGADWITKDGDSGIGTAEAAAAYQYYGDLVRNYGPPGATSLDGTEARGIFQQGKAAMYIDADSGAGLIEDATQSSVAGKVGYAAFPAGPAGAKPYDVTSWAAGVSAYSKNKDASWEFIKWATSSEVLNAAMSDQSSPSPRISSWADSAVTANYPEELVKIFSTYSSTAVGHDRPQVIQVNKARDIVGAPITVALEGGDVTAAAKQASNSFTEFLKTDK
ncbi:ABC transporter substrate-binding protein [Arthrobacter psychrolactophilus]|uniref:ABC transporter substrate-binding protein n=1 Tax=Arthrobacter psychrolactophilus TaxID=92442 RepID=A0A2V5JK81_9MICC|nr:sugar ABC transporter substrate-binding protein [Arthrobacter psychrolactophilus]PYI37846.1 ABC transporter substrate-binding protein [Arthrobacter psychrolactophilus]